MKIAVEVGTTPSKTVRARQVAAAFDVPVKQRDTITWNGDLPIEDRPWNVGLIVGPSGSGKSTIMRHVFGDQPPLRWSGAAVVDDFPRTMSVEDVTAACSAVGFNTIPAWLRPFDVLSTGEQFRVTVARSLVEADPVAGPVVLDEFTSVVDRQVAKIGAHAVQKWCRQRDRQFVAVTCHYDVVDWLQPDWVLDPSSMSFSWRCLQPRPSLQCGISRVPYSSWRLFAPFHYLTAELSKAARCFGLFVEGVLHPVAFVGVLHRPHPSNSKLKGISRVVTLPDWQGLGLAFALMDRIAAAYTALGFQMHMYPAHPSLIRSFDRSPAWELRQRPAKMGALTGNQTPGSSHFRWKQGRRPNAVFRYRGERLDRETAECVVTGKCDRGDHDGEVRRDDREGQAV